VSTLPHTDPPPPSRLESLLLNDARGAIATKEWEVDILRSILRGEIGTPAQRAQLTRLISQFKRRKSAIGWIATNVFRGVVSGDAPFSRATYTNEAQRNHE
jgi:hypothetical protein